MKLKDNIRVTFFKTSQFKLIIYSLILNIIILISTYYISRYLVLKLIINSKANYELSSFEQVGQAIRSNFIYVDNCVSNMYTDSNILSSISNNYKTKASLSNYDKYNLVKNTLPSYFSNTNNIDSIFLIGANSNYYYFNVSGEGNYKNLVSMDFGTNFNFSKLINNKDFFPSENNISSPFYLHKNLEGYEDEKEKRLYTLLNNKIIYSKKIQNENSQLDGIIIISYDTSLLSKSLSTSVSSNSLYLFDENNNQIFNNSNPFPLSTNLFQGKKGYFNKFIKGNKYTFVYDTLSIPKIKLVTQISSLDILREINKSYKLQYILIIYLLVIVTSYFISRRIFFALNAFSREISKTTSPLPQKMDLSKFIFFKTQSLRSKIFAYFIVTVIMPTIISVLIFTYFNYNIYKNTITSLSIRTSKEITKNVDYKLNIIDDISKQIAFNPVVQDTLNISKTTNSLSEEISNINVLYLKTINISKDLLSVNLYNLSGSNIYTNLYPDLKTSNDIFTEYSSEIPKSLTFLEMHKNLLNTNSNFIFTRSITDLNTLNKIGLLTMSMDSNILSSVLPEMKQGDMRYYFITDESGNILIDNNEKIAQSVSFDKATINSITKNDHGYKYVTVDKVTYLLIYNSTDLLNFKIVGMYPIKEIISKVYIVFIYSLFVLIIYLSIILFISTLISKSITTPLFKLNSAIEDINKGNLNVHLQYKPKDEVWILVTQFNNMVDKLHELINENYQSKIRESQLLFLEKEAQLNALQQQINPHFLYNTLESIKWMAYKKGALEVCEMTNYLGKFFRGVVVKGSDSLTISEELEHVNNYLYIQKMRYQNRFEVIISVDDNIKNFRIKKLILQPIIENAINHGIENKLTGGLITIKGYLLMDMIHFEIYDNGIGMNKEELDALLAKIKAVNENSTNESIGLSNVYSRLFLYYNTHFTFDIISEINNGTTVKIAFPNSIS